MSETVKPRGPLSPEIAKLAKKLEEDPRSKVFIPLAEEYVKAGYYEEAAAVLEEGVNSYPNFVTALVALGRVYVYLNETAKAQKVLQEVTRQSPENLLAHRTLAKLYLQAGQLNDAMRSCDIVLKANPKDADTLALKAKITAKGAAPEQVSDAEPSATESVAQAEAPTFRLHSGDQVQPAVPARQTAPPVVQRPDRSAKVARLQRVLETIRQRREPVDDPA